MRRLRQAGLRRVEVMTVDQSPGVQGRVTILDFVRTRGAGFLAGTPENFPTAHENGRLLVFGTRCSEVRICLLNAHIGFAGTGAYNDDVAWFAAAHRDHPSDLVRHVYADL